MQTGMSVPLREVNHPESFQTEVAAATWVPSKLTARLFHSAQRLVKSAGWSQWFTFQTQMHLAPLAAKCIPSGAR